MPKKAAKKKLRAKRRNEERSLKNKTSRSNDIQIANPIRRSGSKTQLEVLFSRGAITEQMKAAGDRLYRDWHRSGAQPQLCSAVWTSTGMGKGEMTQTQVEAHHRFRDAIQAVGLILSPVLIDVCLWERSAGDWAELSAKPRADGPAVLRLGLDALVNHYSTEKKLVAA